MTFCHLTRLRHAVAWAPSSPQAAEREKQVNPFVETGYSRIDNSERAVLRRAAEKARVEEGARGEGKEENKWDPA